VPPELRRGFGLPTYEYQDAVWAYYFYRLISRAENVWMLYDSRTEGLKNGEESRYIKQLKYHFHVPVHEYVSKGVPGLPSEEGHEIEKTPEILEKISRASLSPSALQNYIDCPMRFYYYTVAKLKKEKEVVESMDAAMIGNVYHNTMWALFTSEEEMLSDNVYDKRKTKPEPMTKVTKEYLESWKKREKDVRRKVESLMREELGTDEISGRNLVTVSVIVRYVMETIKRDVELLSSWNAGHFQIVGLERPLSAEMYGLKFYGVADRIDRIGELGVVRMVDYKSGKDDPSVLNTQDAKAAEVAETIFNGDKEKRKKVKAGLQFFIYDKMLQANGIAPLNDVCNSMYATSGLFSQPPAVCPLNQTFAKEMDQRLESLLKEIQSPEVPFRMTEEVKNCEWCDFRMICGR
jgi:RecB family exonuclease